MTPRPLKFVVLLDRSAGNESVGEMWTETCLFSPAATLADVEQWIRSRVAPYAKEPGPFSSNVRLTVCQEPQP